jgi:hypothetical protein
LTHPRATGFSQPHPTRQFRHDYLDYDALTRQLCAWAAAHPEIVRLRSLGRTPEERELWLAVIGAEPETARPGIWVNANMHASELCGSSVALAIAEDALRLHTEPDWDAHGLPESTRRVLRSIHFYILPRMSPDGAEAVLKTGRWIRSVPRRPPGDRQDPFWVARDIDGDGLCLTLRRRDSAGDYVESTRTPGLMLPRDLLDAGPFYRLYPEGVIENFTGERIPGPGFLDDNSPDLNRNFPWGWAPEPEQEGAGPYAASEPESRAVTEFATRTPGIFAWIDLHTFGGVFIRPLGHGPDTQMDPEDLGVYRQIERWAEELSGYPMVSGFEEFTYTPGKPLHGDLIDFAYHQRGALAYVCELWDLFSRLGVKRPKRFCDHYTRLERSDLERLADWDREHNGRRWLRPWRPCLHPQLGDVEVGGFDPRVGIWNPPPEELSGLCSRQAALAFRVAALTPCLRFGKPLVRPLEGGMAVVECDLENQGYLPTYVLGSARKKPLGELLSVQALPEGCSLTDPHQAHRLLEHLSGWGRGLYRHSLLFPRADTGPNRHRLSWVVSGHGRLTLRASGPRVGVVELVVDLDAAAG